MHCSNPYPKLYDEVTYNFYNLYNFIKGFPFAVGAKPFFILYVSLRKSSVEDSWRSVCLECELLI